MKHIAVILILAGLAPMGWSGGMENDRSPLPQIDAGGILNQIQNSRNDFPQPNPTAPDLKDKHISSSQLKDLLRDSNPEIRKAAVKSARTYILNSFAYERVMDILENANERLDIRVEAARTLSYAAGNSRIRESLVDIIKYGNNPRELRVMSYKALWGVAGGHSRIQDFLRDAIKYSEKDLDARRAAIWAIFDATRNSRPREVLLDLLRYGNEEELTRIEAVKSLYGAMGYSRVKELMMDLVRNSNEKKPVKLAAIAALSGASGDSRVQNFLKDLMRYGADTEIKTAAIEAAAPNMAKIREYFHLGYKVENGGFVSPIEKE
ncbi:MAG: HEAT repeat domain-containing protein [Elusimicrobia bacterium]|nr:HEAT repeat domain-containing protein [Elusimicrobiota bacterium]